jgi:uncharacterized protein YhfF
MTEETILNYWHQFQTSLPPDSPYRAKAYVAEGWGDSPQLADELGALIVQGSKTATCSALWEWEEERNPIPKTGYLTIALDGRGEPLCIVETIEISIRKYNEVDPDFAREEGEGDLSLDYWREAHRNYFSRVLKKLGKEFSEDMPLVCERFRVIYR